MTVRFSTAASHELMQQLEYYGEQSKRAQSDFLDEIEGALKLIAGYPAIAPAVRGNIHRFTIRKFSIGLYYTVAFGDQVTIVSLLHLKSNPDTINERLKR